jgi:hypothetical protein
MQTEANQQLYISSSLTTRARADAWRRERLLAGAPARQPQPIDATAYMQRRAWQAALCVLLGTFFFFLVGALWPEATHSRSLEPAPTATHSRLDWYYSDAPND